MGASTLPVNISQLFSEALTLSFNGSSYTSSNYITLLFTRSSFFSLIVWDVTRGNREVSILYFFFKRVLFVSFLEYSWNILALPLNS